MVMGVASARGMSSFVSSAVSLGLSTPPFCPSGVAPTPRAAAPMLPEAALVSREASARSSTAAFVSRVESVCSQEAQAVSRAASSSPPAASSWSEEAAVVAQGEGFVTQGVDLVATREALRRFEAAVGSMNVSAARTIEEARDIEAPVVRMKDAVGPLTAEAEGIESTAGDVESNPGAIEDDPGAVIDNPVRTSDDA